LSPYNPVTGDSYQSDILYGQVIKTDRDETVLLPSLNLIYHDKKNQKVRVSYSNTVARPEFREMAPFEFQAFYGGNPIVGFPYLKTTRIRNYDIRYEKYKMAGEIFSTGIFFKNFTNPIEKVIIETADESYLTFQNADYAYTYGVEIDYRSYMPILPVDKGKIMVIFNVTLSQSQVKSPEKIQLFTGATTLNHSQTLKRPLQGQSNIILNASLNYTGLQGISSSISYNAFSPRLYALGSGDAPNEYEYPFHSLNLTISKTFGALNVSLKMKNLLNSEMKFGFNKDGKRYITNQYHPGIGASVSLSYAM
ncbi:MAG: TonB-dependent receptor, partial [Candidatus Marinimicrobia bacterium]|nr:TonB-dependent receptor [Candidatus Neomarinimicrobiota bacterium]